MKKEDKASIVLYGKGCLFLFASGKKIRSGERPRMTEFSESEIE